MFGQQLGDICLSIGRCLCCAYSGIHIFQKLYSLEYICAYFKECTFPNPAPKGRTDTSYGHLSPQSLVEYVQYQYINSADIFPNHWQYISNTIRYLIQGSNLLGPELPGPNMPNPIFFGAQFAGTWFAGVQFTTAPKSAGPNLPQYRRGARYAGDQFA